MVNTFSLGANSAQFYDNIRALLASPDVGVRPQQRADLQGLLDKTPQQIECGDFISPSGFGRIAMYVFLAMAAKKDSGKAVILVPSGIMTPGNIGRLATTPQVNNIVRSKSGVILNDNIIVADFRNMDAVLKQVGTKNISLIIAGDAYNDAGKRNLAKLRDLSVSVPVFGLNAPAKYSEVSTDFWITSYEIAQKYIVGNYIKIRDAIVDVHKAQVSEGKYKNVKIAAIKKGNATSVYLYESDANINAFMRAAKDLGYNFNRRLEELGSYLIEDKTDAWLTPGEVIKKYIQGNPHKIGQSLRAIYAAQKKHNKYQNIKIERRTCGSVPTLCAYDSPENIKALITVLRRSGMNAITREQIAKIPQKTDSWLSVMGVIDKYIEGSQNKVRDAVFAVVKSASKFPNVKCKKMVNASGNQNVYVYDSEENISALIAAARSLGHNISRRNDAIAAKNKDWATSTEVSQTIVGNKHKIIAAMRDIYAAQKSTTPRFADIELQEMRSYSNITLCLHMTPRNVGAFLDAAAELGYVFKLRSEKKSKALACGADAVRAAAQVALNRLSFGIADNVKKR